MTAGSQLPVNELEWEVQGASHVQQKAPEQFFLGRAISVISSYGTLQTVLSTRMGLPEAAHRLTD